MRGQRIAASIGIPDTTHIQCEKSRNLAIEAGDVSATAAIKKAAVLATGTFNIVILLCYKTVILNCDFYDCFIRCSTLVVLTSAGAVPPIVKLI
jgi:hypothetical protein